MSAFNALAQEVLRYALERSVAFAVVFLVVGATWLLLRRWLSSPVGNLWFLLPLTVLVLPLERWIPNPWSHSNPIERAALAILPSSLESIFVDPATEGFLDFGALSEAAPRLPMAGLENAGLAAAPSAARTLSPAGWILCLWMLGMLGFLLRLNQGQRQVPQLLRMAMRLAPEAIGIDLAQLRRQAGVKQRVTLYESPEFDSPVIWSGGLLGQMQVALVLPEGLSKRLSAHELRWVLLHELAHVARKDHQMELLQRLLGAAFCFHPLVWASNRIARGYREMACDDAALVRCAVADRVRCGRALFEVVAHAAALNQAPGKAARKYRTTHAMASLFNSKKLTRRRIMRLIEIDRPLARGLQISALIPVLLASSAALAAARFPAVSLQEEAESIFEELADDEEGIFEIIELPGSSIEETREAVLRATDWLLANQSQDGGWTYAQVVLEEEAGDTPAGWAKNLGSDIIKEVSEADFDPYHSDVALTALALQALTRRALYEPTNKELGRAMDRAVNSLIERQDPSSGVYGTHSASFMVGQALATEAIAKASGEHLLPKRKESLQRAVAFLERSRNPYAGWRYESPPNGDNDTRMTGYVLLALSAAYEVGIEASQESFQSGMHYLLECEDGETGRTNYMRDAKHAFRLLSHRDSHPAERAETPTAMHMRLRNDAGIKAASNGIVQAATRLLGSKAPLWNEPNGTIDYTYWWQAAEALSGSPVRGDIWKSWSLRLRGTLQENQVLDGPLKGTWPTDDAWSRPGLEVYTAATGALALYAVLDAE